MGLILQIKNFVQSLFPAQKTDSSEGKQLYSETEVIEQIHSIWDYLSFTAHSQAYHICNVLGFEEWVPMDEILRRVKELFGVEYQNERSLYPYIKTLVDCNLLESSGFAGKKHWRKKELLVKIEGQKKKQEITAQTAKAASRPAIQQ